MRVSEASGAMHHVFIIIASVACLFGPPRIDDRGPTTTDRPSDRPTDGLTETTTTDDGERRTDRQTDNRRPNRPTDRDD